MPGRHLLSKQEGEKIFLEQQHLAIAQLAEVSLRDNWSVILSPCLRRSPCHLLFTAQFDASRITPGGDSQFPAPFFELSAGSRCHLTNYSGDIFILPFIYLGLPLLSVEIFLDTDLRRPSTCTASDHNLK